VKHDLFEVPGLPVWGNVNTLDNIMYLKIAVGAVKPAQQVAAVDRNCGVPWRTFLVEQGLYYMLQTHWTEGPHNRPRGHFLHVRCLNCGNCAWTAYYVD
jgi:hypothetical protein